MRRKLIAGNWKMHGSNALVHDLLSKIIAASSDLAVDLAVFPPFVYLDQSKKLLTNSAVKLGAQTLSAEKTGAFTGEIAGEMLKEVGCHYVLVGHSERRQYHQETDDLVARQFVRALEAGLTPILCVGETLTEREANQTNNVVLRQLNAVMEKYGVEAVKKGVLAYEPVWAIGTGQTATPEQAQSVHALLRDAVAQKDTLIAKELRILYGGSVKSANAKSLFSMNDIDGGLIGGASLNAEEFLLIAQVG